MNPRLLEEAKRFETPEANLAIEKGIDGKTMRVLGGLLVRRERWTLSLRGKVLVFLVTMAVVFAGIEGMYPFLAVTSRTSGEILVVEGWIHSDSMEQAANEYRAANYQDVLVVAAVYALGNKWDSGRYMPEYIAESLVRLGVPKDRVHVVFCEVVKKYRTYESALAVKKWLREHGVSAKSIDVVTVGPHARRSRLLFQKAFGTEVNVGVIAMDERAYDPMHWWRSSEGVREVLFESFAYVYAKFLFWPAFVCAGTAAAERSAALRPDGARVEGNGVKI